MLLAAYLRRLPTAGRLRKPADSGTYSRLPAPNSPLLGHPYIVKVGGCVSVRLNTAFDLKFTVGKPRPGFGHINQGKAVDPDLGSILQTTRLRSAIPLLVAQCLTPFMTHSLP